MDKIIIKKETSDSILSFLKLIAFLLGSFIAVEYRYAKEEKIQAQEKKILKQEGQIKSLFNALPEDQRKKMVEQMEIEEKFDHTPNTPTK